MKLYYESALSELIQLVKNRKNKIVDTHRELEMSMNELLYLGDARFGAYKSMVESNECSAAKVIENIAVKLFTEFNNNFEFYPIQDKYKKLIASEQAKSRPFQIVINENGERIGIVFCTQDDMGEKYNRFISGEYKVDSLKLVVISSPDLSAYEALFASVNKYNHQVGVNLERIPILDFWEQYFGINECNNLIDFINDFNEKAKEIIAFSTIVSPTEEALKKFKENCGLLLQETKLPLDNEKELISKISLRHNYIDRGLWRAMIGTSDFANSFITSEWFYSMYQLTENLDLTNIVTGYLKSIEQLLYSIIKLSIDTGITIKSKGSRKIVEFTKENEEIVDTTLGSLEKVIEFNGKLLDVNTYTKHVLISIIDDWREKQRNGYFHKHNIHSLEKVDEIRTKALQLYYLILGSLTIKDEHVKDLGIV